ncbi:MAG: FAD-binding oxidoreductase, partial [Deltaproteobacteria bacterium]|nr:FAD-binding oxidoreductase [Deltaproteobacteria bacterium]
GWGFEGEGPDGAATRKIGAALARRFDVEPREPVEPPRIEELDLRAPRVSPPAALRDFVTGDPHERARHSYGRGYRDLVRIFRRDFESPPDQVAFPRDEGEVASVLDWCGSNGYAAIPFGGGSSVVGGVRSDGADGFPGVVSLDTTRLDGLLELDTTSRAARFQAGVYGPALEDALRPHGLTLRHFPQSFEFSTLGGWIATRAGGHFATRYTHIDDFVESLRVVTPSGVLETRRLPGSGAGPSPDRLMLGSEGAFGVITEAWMRLQDRPVFRASASVWFSGFAAGADAVRALSQSGLEPANCRLLDAGEAAASAGGSGDESLLVLAFESADHPLDAWLARALELCRDLGGRVPDDSVRIRNDSQGAREGASGAWRNSFVSAPYARDALIALGFISETFETAIPWDRFEAFHEAVSAAASEAIERVCGGGTLTCRFTHVYPDGPAPYYTIMAPGEPGRELEQWDEIKLAASEALHAHGGTITHHHAVGRDHRPWYDRQRPELFGRALRAAKSELDPAGILNPGVLIDAA